VFEEAKKARDEGRIMLSTLGRERMYNPFLRYDDPVIKRQLHSAHREELERQRALAQSEDEAVFRCLRALRNHW
jgi:hypothetical protein